MRWILWGEKLIYLLVFGGIYQFSWWTRGKCELKITGCDRCVVGEDKMILVVLDKGI